MRLKFLHHLMAIVDQREPRALSAAVLGPETEDGYLVLVRFVEFGEFCAELVFGDVGTGGVEDVTGMKGELVWGVVGGCDRRDGEGERTYTTICLRPRSGLRMNLRVRSVTGCSLSAMIAVVWSFSARNGKLVVTRTALLLVIEGVATLSKMLAVIR